MDVSTLVAQARVLEKLFMIIIGRGVDYNILALYDFDQISYCLPLKTRDIIFEI